VTHPSSEFPVDELGIRSLFQADPVVLPKDAGLGE
jgi:hypothetical protein